MKSTPLSINENGKKYWVTVEAFGVALTLSLFNLLCISVICIYTINSELALMVSGNGALIGIRKRKPRC